MSPVPREGAAHALDTAQGADIPTKTKNARRLRDGRLIQRGMYAPR